MSTSDIQGLTGGHTIYLYPLPIILIGKIPLPTFWYDVTENPMDIFANPVFPQKSLWGKCSTIAIRFQHTQKRNLTD